MVSSAVEVQKTRNKFFKGECRTKEPTNGAAAYGDSRGSGSGRAWSRGREVELWVLEYGVEHLSRHQV